MPAPGTYGVPNQSAFGIPVTKSPLRAYIRQTTSDSATSQGDTVTLTLPSTPLPGSVLVASWDAEKPSGGGTVSPDCYDIDTTGYRWSPVHQHGNLDTNYPYIELWVGIPVPGVVGGTAVTNPGARGGWRSFRVMEVPNIQGLMIDGSTLNWNNSSSITTTMSFAAPQDCVAIAYGAIDSGGAGLVFTLTAGWAAASLNGDGCMAMRTLPKGQVASIAATAGRTDLQVVAIVLMI